MTIEIDFLARIHRVCSQFQNNNGQIRDRWEICSIDEERLIVQQFLRFPETRTLAQVMLTGYSCVCGRVTNLTSNTISSSANLMQLIGSGNANGPLSRTGSGNVHQTECYTSIKSDSCRSPRTKENRSDSDVKGLPFQGVTTLASPTTIGSFTMSSLSGSSSSSTSPSNDMPKRTGTQIPESTLQAQRKHAPTTVQSPQMRERRESNRTGTPAFVSCTDTLVPHNTNHKTTSVSSSASGTVISPCSTAINIDSRDMNSGQLQTVFEKSGHANPFIAAMAAAALTGFPQINSDLSAFINSGLSDKNTVGSGNPFDPSGTINPGISDGDRVTRSQLNQDGIPTTDKCSEENKGTRNGLLIPNPLDNWLSAIQQNCPISTAGSPMVGSVPFPLPGFPVHPPQLMSALAAAFRSAKPNLSAWQTTQTGPTGQNMTTNGFPYTGSNVPMEHSSSWATGTTCAGSKAPTTFDHSKFYSS